mmetsp:Transcript_14448/g.34587  ORF Transcript_14448/g.34587 Transcript_14448/m.34587 type:complete len:238 (-) Transcript_14448:247-960(-)
MTEQNTRHLRPGAIPNLISLPLEALSHFGYNVVNFGIVPGVLQFHPDGDGDGGEEEDGQSRDDADAPRDRGMDQLLVPILEFRQHNVVDAVVVVVVIVSASIVEGVEGIVVLIATGAIAVVVPVVVFAVTLPVVEVVVAMAVGLVLLVVVRRQVDDVPSRPDHEKDQRHEGAQRRGAHVRPVRVEDVPGQRIDAELEGRPRVVRHRQSRRLRFVEAGGLVEHVRHGGALQAAQLVAD